MMRRATQLETWHRDVIEYERQYEHTETCVCCQTILTACELAAGLPAVTEILRALHDNATPRHRRPTR